MGKRSNDNLSKCQCVSTADNLPGFLLPEPTV